MKEQYNFRDVLEEYSIVIPKIQRDYAQGRNTDKAKDVREKLLNDIFSGKAISLDFIFGTIQNLEERIFVPLDGQQRLTTLFLLYLYGKKMKGLEISTLNKFTYQTRKAAQDFCEKIVQKDWPRNFQGDLSKLIIDQKWFMHYWLNDPTIEGMLTMLDAIHEHAEKLNNFPDLDTITFRFFDMNEHNLTDDLYIKMNSRGKALTAFENLKAAIDKILPHGCFPHKEEEKSFEWLQKPELNDKSFSEKWKYCMDREWSDMFWHFNENALTDAAFIRFFVNVIAPYWIGRSNISADDKGEKDEFLCFLLGITGEEDYVSFDKLKAVFQMESNGDEPYKIDKNDTLLYLARCLNSFYIIHQTPDLQKKISPSWEKDEYDLLEKVLSLDKEGKYSVSFKERTMFYSLIRCPYLTLLPEKQVEAWDKIKHWMRVTWNIIEQAETRARNMIAAVKLINELSETITPDIDIYVWLAKDDHSIKSRFMESQIAEEVVKAQWILNVTDKEGQCNNSYVCVDTKRESEILEAEGIDSFKGAIRFLYRDSKGSLNWYEFGKKLENAKSYFKHDNKSTFELAEYCEDEQIRTIWGRYSFAHNNWKTILLRSDLYDPVHHFLIGDGKRKDSVLLCDLKNLLDTIKEYNIWLLKDWQDCRTVLTNYSVMRTEPYNGWVFEVGNEIRNHWNEVVCGIDEVEVQVPSACGEEQYFINGQVYYRGLWSDIKYVMNGKSYCFRYYGDNTVRLLPMGYVERKYMSKDEVGDEYSFKVTIDLDKETLLQNLEAIIQRKESSETDGKK